ncbi:MFS transporter [Athalassotoga saccharophila]|uniref:MFS transporter n=1 Tax=Athalassotoga saccharophila TaxID=1441386 RepID=UPI00137B2066|nr:MFS transporter [Athalassotoga saccharophila]BBJ29033.1 putative L-galactonate transporter [Athalassotoga saccharophila]
MNKKFMINFVSLISSRAAYALNWYNISPLYIFIESSLAIPLSKLGEIPTSFLLGAGIFQIPSGLLAAKIGNKRVAMAGMYLLSIMSLLSGFSWSLESMMFFRFFVGVGAAMYFSPALGIIKNVFSEKNRGMAMGFYNGAFNLGAGIGIAAWNAVAIFTGWRVALIIGGIIGLAITIENNLLLPPDEVTKEKVEWKKVLGNKDVWLIGLSLAGFWGAFFATAQFLSPYLVKKGMNGDLAGLISSLTLIAGAVGGPLIGMISDKIKKRKQFMILLSLVMFFLISTIFLANAFVIWIYTFLLGFLSAGIFSILYAIPAGYKEISPRLLPLSISLINSVQISVGSIAPYLFTLTAARFSFTFGWISLGIFLLVFLPLTKFAKDG